jgi:hypothetical protein
MADEDTGTSTEPGEPPEKVRSEVFWRLAARLYRDHDHTVDDGRCGSCGHPWPCSGRRLAELGLMRASC